MYQIVSFNTSKRKQSSKNLPSLFFQYKPKKRLWTQVNKKRWQNTQTSLLLTKMNPWLVNQSIFLETKVIQYHAPLPNTISQTILLIHMIRSTNLWSSSAEKELTTHKLDTLLLIFTPQLVHELPKKLSPISQNGRKDTLKAWKDCSNPTFSAPTLSNYAANSRLSLNHRNLHQPRIQFSHQPARPTPSRIFPIQNNSSESNTTYIQAAQQKLQWLLGLRQTLWSNHRGNFRWLFTTNSWIKWTTSRKTTETPSTNGRPTVHGIHFYPTWSVASCCLR